MRVGISAGPVDASNGPVRPTPRRRFIMPTRWWILASAPMVLALAVPVVRYGDASDYAMMAMSIARDRDLRYERADLERVMATRPVGTDYPAGMFLIRDRTGTLRIGGHGFSYPLVAAPFYLVFGFRGFALLNALLLGICMIMAAEHVAARGTQEGWMWAVAAVCFSAAFDYTIWPTPETWLLFLGAAFLFAYGRRRFLIAGACLGLAAASQAPMALWAALPIIDLLRGEIRLRDTVGLVVAASALLAPQLVYNVVTSGTMHSAWLDLRSPARFLYYPLAFPGQEHFDRASHAAAFARFSRLEHARLGSMVAAVVSPRMGLLWFYPLSALAILRMWRQRQGGVALIAAGLVLAAFCTAGQLESHQVGLRYLNPVYPVLLLGFRSFRWDRVERALLVAGVVLGLTFALFPRVNSRELVSRKAVPAALLYR